MATTLPTPKGEPHRLRAWVTNSGLLEWEIDHYDCEFDGFYQRCPLGELIDWLGADAFIDGPPEEPGLYTTQLYEDGDTAERWVEINLGTM